MKPETQSSISGLLGELLESIAREDGKVVIEAKNGLVSLTHEYEDEPCREAVKPSYDVNMTIRRLIDALLTNSAYVVELVSDKETYHLSFDSLTEARDYALGLDKDKADENKFDVIRIWDCTLDKRSVVNVRKKAGTK